MNSAARQLIEETKPLVQLYDQGDYQRAGAMAIANRLAEIQKADPQLSQRAIGEAFGHGQEWVRKLVQWCTNDFRGSPFADAANPAKAGPAHAQQVLRSPSQRKTALAGLSQQEKADVASELMAEPAVVEAVVAAPGKAQKHIRTAVEDREVRDARERIANAKKAAEAHKAMPLSAYFWSIVRKLDEWDRSLKSIESELATLPDGQRDEVGRHYQRLADRCDKGLAILFGGVDSTDVIEGHGESVKSRQLT